MKTLQKMFEKLVGITPGELDRLSLATQVFGSRSGINMTGLEKPACWRRPPRYRRG